MLSLKRLVPQDSIWSQRQQREEDLKNEKFLQKQGSKVKVDAALLAAPTSQSERTNQVQWVM